ncbi:MAG TPA: PIG-L family deacetylase [Candidatus Angelobacter sp.]|nr:PIG-L family deacetylase [Candidatus Angelobacter sp.]
MLRLLCITAHPDDEAGGFGGTLLHYAEKGVETQVICLTPGQAATHRAAAKSDEELSAMRKREFAASCDLLRVSKGLVLDYPDGKLDREDFYPAVEDLTHRLREFRPHVVMTFGTEGAFTAHPDHSMVSIFATMAFHWAARDMRFPQQLTNGLKSYQAQKLYYATALFTMPDRPRVSLPPVTTVIEIGTRGSETKIAAFRCHTSQAPLFPYFESTVHKRSTQERFHLAACAIPGVLENETDLFSGVKED